MKTSNIVIVMLVLMAALIVLMVSGCNNKPNRSDTSAVTEQQVDQVHIGEITDPEELQKLWEEYLYDTITTVGNTPEFNSAAEIDPTAIAQYVWYKYTYEHGINNLELADEGHFNRLLPLDIVLEYAHRYFKLNALDLSNVDDYHYDPQQQTFAVGISMRTDYPHYINDRSWNIHLDKAVKNTDGSTTAVLVSYDSSHTRRVQYTMTYTLKQHEDGSLYFASGKREWVNNSLVTLTGDYKHFERLSGFHGEKWELSMVGQSDDYLILAHTPYAKGSLAALMLINPQTMTVERKLELDYNPAFSDISLLGDNLIIRLDRKVLVINKQLEIIKEAPLPKVIIDTMEREVNYDENGFPDVFFGGYDVTKDLKMFVYSDEVGVKIFDTADNSERMLSKTVPVKGSSLIDKSYHLVPRFAAEDKKVITTMTGYETSMGYTLCHIEKDDVRTLNISQESSYTGNIRYDTGLLEVNTSIYDPINQSASAKTLYLDFKTGAVTEIKFDSPGETGYIRDYGHTYVGEKYAAFITHEYDRDYTNNISYINRLSLSTFAVESNLVSVKAANTYILGVLDDGRIVFWYDFNPSERGICITNKAEL